MATQPIPTSSQTPSRVGYVKAQIERLLNYRRQFDPRWLALYKQYVGYRPSQLYPDNATKRSNVFIPYPYSNVEVTSSRIMDAFFGYFPCFETRGRGSNDDNASELMQVVLEYKLARAKWSQPFEIMIKTGAIYGIMAMKVDWDWTFDTIAYKEPIYKMVPEMAPIQDPATGQVVGMQPTGGEVPMEDPTNPGQPLILGYQMKTAQVPRSCPKFIPIDPYDLIIDPDQGLVGMMTEKTLGTLKREQEGWIMGHQPEEGEPQPTLYDPEALKKLEENINSWQGFGDNKEFDPSTVLVRLCEFWDVAENLCTIITVDDKKGMEMKDARAALRGQGYTSYRRAVYTGESITLWEGPNPFAHKRNPIVYTSFSKLPEQVYGMGVVEPTADLVDRLSRHVGMLEDKWNVGLNTRVGVDINKLVDEDSLNYMNIPGGKIRVDGPPAEAIFPFPSYTPTAQDYEILPLFKGVIEMTSGISDFYGKGVGSGGGNDTATGITSIIGEQNLKFKRAMENIELDILQPALEMCASNVQQFMSDQEEIAITDAPPGIPKRLQVSPQELVGNFSFSLVGPTYMASGAIAQRNLMALQNVLMQSPFVNQYYLTRETLKAFRIPGMNRILKSEEQVQQEQQQQLAMQLQLEEAQADEQQKRDLEKIVVSGAVGEEVAIAKEKAKPKPAGGKSSGKKEGRPRKAQFEGKIPGGGATSAIRELAQELGGNALGLESLGEKGIGGMR